jgi:prepilin-type N-terminal cleavage/methylation domain-containing protein
VTRARPQAGFTLVEVLIATVAMAVLAGGAYALLSAALSAEGVAQRTQAAVGGAAQLALAVAGEVARCEAVLHAAGDSLTLRLPGGQKVAYGARDTAEALEVYRTRLQGTVWVEEPMHPLARLLHADGTVPAIAFAQGPPGVVTCRITTAGFDGQFAASRWVGP